MNRSLCIIPARGKSKRIPEKNIKDFLGKPIIAYSIKTALESKLFDKVMVSTDDLEIAKVAQKYGAEIPFMRSEVNSNDFATTADVVAEVLFEYDKIKIFENLCCLYPTAPMTTADQLIKGYEKLISGKYDTVFPVVPFSYPIWRGFKKKSNGELEMLWPQHLNDRSQDLEKIYHDAGQWYWISRNSVVERKGFFTSNSSAIVMDEMEVQDIDNLNDWKMAELKYEILQSTR